MTLASSPTKAWTRRSASAASSGAATVPVSSTVLVPIVATLIFASGIASVSIWSMLSMFEPTRILADQIDVAGGVAGVDRGLAAGLAEHVELALRLDLHVGDRSRWRRRRRPSCRARSTSWPRPIERTISLRRAGRPPGRRPVRQAMPASGASAQAAISADLRRRRLHCLAPRLEHAASVVHGFDCVVHRIT